jgi:hypothetical protein
MEHKSSKQIVSDVETAKRLIEIGARYSHYKDPSKIYLVADFGTLEATDELCVIYQAEYDPKLLFIRPIDQWLEKVEWNDGLVSRFTKIKDL